jgi:hypothetical protein
MLAYPQWGSHVHLWPLHVHVAWAVHVAGLPALPLGLRFVSSVTHMAWHGMAWQVVPPPFRVLVIDSGEIVR